jgi:hypothetical protein
VLRIVGASGIISSSAEIVWLTLRSGFITSAAGCDVAEWKIQQVSKHKSTEVLRGYIQDAGQGSMEAVKAVMGD